MANGNGFGRWLVKLLIRLILLGVVLFGVALGVLCLAEGNPPPRTGNNDAIIVLGAQVYANGELSPQLELRMEAALREWKRHPVPVVTCGAQGKNEPGPEGEIMRQWLIKQGVPEKQVIAETESRDTRENLLFAARLLPENVKNITIVTSDYHLPRALALAGDLGFRADGIGSPCKQEYWVKNHFREVLAWGKYFAVKWGILK